MLVPPVASAAGADSWTDVIVDVGLTEDRYLSAVETLPGDDAQRIIHHVLTLCRLGGPVRGVVSERLRVGRQRRRLP